MTRVPKCTFLFENLLEPDCKVRLMIHGVLQLILAKDACYIMLFYWVGAFQAGRNL